ncbi:MAG: DUF4340 domain-containing protein [Pirellulaceae bacterium]|nr:DUF4340 domain-containing protein [Pirellulaceae bacterium]
MTEGVKTLIYLGVALVVAVSAFVSRPRQIEVVLDEKVGEVLFDTFDDPSKAASMEFVRYDSEMGELRDFKVARDKQSGAWTIPSNAGYPADAEQRMRDAALMLVDLKVLGIASQVPADHAYFGVLEPDREKLRLGDDGVGQLLTFEDAKGQSLAGVIIGKTVKGADDQRYVRIPGQDIVYVVRIDPKQLSTRFQDWIEQDLLKLSSWDIEEVAVKNYSVEREMTRATLIRDFDFAAKFADNEWKLIELTNYRNGEPSKVAELPANQELDKDKLNSLKTAVDDLKIVDVFRKPKGLGRDLKAGTDFMKDLASQKDLQARGFYPYETAGAAELYCANGEVHVGMKDGVQYVLRFGETVADTGDEPAEGRNRYLFVTARVNMDKFPQPELEAVPELPSGVKEKSESGAADEQPKPEAAESDAADAEPKTEADAEREAAEAVILQERERINKENQRKLDDWNENVKKAKEKVAELNTRFGDWYYVVSEDQYKKIRLPLSDLIKNKTASEDSPDTSAAPEVEGDGVDAFRNLQDQGLEP